MNAYGKIGSESFYWEKCIVLTILIELECG